MNASTGGPPTTTDGGLFVATYRSLAELLVGTLTFVVIIFMTVCGNALVVLAVFTYRPLTKVQNYFLVSLASSDLCVATLVMPLHVVKFLSGGRWVFGLVPCQMWLTLDILCCTASILNLCAIALDRYWAITQPIAYANRRTLTLVLLMIVGVWAVSALISIPPLIGLNDWTTTNLHDRCELTTHKGFVVFSACGSFYVPWAIMVIVYVKIFLAARKRIRTNRDRSALGAQLRDRRRSEAPTESRSPATPAARRERLQLLQRSRTEFDEVVENEPSPPTATPPTRRSTLVACESLSGAAESRTQLLDSHSAERAAAAAAAESRAAQPAVVAVARERISVAKEKKAAKTLAVIMGVFVLCWLPFFVMYVLMAFCERCYLHPKVTEAITWLGYINSAINPLIYTIFNMDFRRAFEKFLCPKSVNNRRRFLQKR